MPTNTEAMAVTRKRNQAAGIDFAGGLDPATLGSRQAATTTRSSYVKKLQQLVDAIDAGEAEYGKAYKIGEFRAEGSAAQIARNVSKREDLPAMVAFELFPVRVKGGGSELWVGVNDPNAEIEDPTYVVDLDETAAILADPETMAAIAEGVADLDGGYITEDIALSPEYIAPDWNS